MQLKQNLDKYKISKKVEQQKNYNEMHYLLNEIGLKRRLLENICFIKLVHAQEYNMCFVFLAQLMQFSMH